MIRTKSKFIVPDVINADPHKGNYTVIPNSILRNPTLSFKAKGMLAYLLSNKEGWKTSIEGLMQVGTDREASINSGKKELIQAGYLLVVTYRNQQKRNMGSFWCYTTEPYVFDIGDTIKSLSNIGMECFVRTGEDVELYENLKGGFLNLGFLNLGFLNLGNPGLIILNNNKTKNNKTKDAKASSSEETSEENVKIQSLDKLVITKSMFDKFWKIYPRKTGKGKALTAWNTICTKKIKERPTWVQVKRAILQQKKTPQWNNPKFIPYASTWINQSRWLDDPEEMKGPFTFVQPPTKLRTKTGHRDKDPVWQKMLEDRQDRHKQSINQPKN